VPRLRWTPGQAQDDERQHDWEIRNEVELSWSTRMKVEPAAHMNAVTTSPSGPSHGSRRRSGHQARRTATEERLRMAQDLHDGVGHGLAVIAMQAGVALHVLDRGTAKARESLLAIRETSRESLDALRAELSRLATDPAALATRAVHDGLDDLPGLVARVRAGGLQVDLRSSHDAVPDHVAEAAYLVVQEALTNVLRHSGATSAAVDVSSVDDTLLVRVVDDGQGGDVQDGLGLQGMRTRVERLGGALRVGPTTGGFEVRATFPVDG
jgi:signal transduction histidine kinase